MKIRRTLAVIALAAAVCCTGGCFTLQTDTLYSLPQASEEYIQLQAQIDAVLDTGAEYAPPISGPNRQSVQLRDIDNDGTSEAVAFFYLPGDRPLKIYIFRHTDGSYAVADIIEGLGTAIESIQYVDMNGNGTVELVVGWRMSPALKHMSLYAMRGLQHTQIAEADYSELTYGALTDGGNTQVIALRLPAAELPGEAQVFSLMEDGEVVSVTAPLSNGLGTLSRIQIGRLSDGVPAVFAEGGYAGTPATDTDMMTDIIAFTDDGLKNVTAGLNAPDGDATVREITVYARDVDGDGCLEVPQARALAAQSGTASTYYAIDWYAISSSGGRTYCVTTYNNATDRWYLYLPEDWHGKVSVRRVDAVGIRELVFSYMEDGDRFIDFLKIYTLTGENREDRAALGGRFTLAAHGDTIYAAELLQEQGSFGLTFSQEYVQENFRILYTE